MNTIVVIQKRSEVVFLFSQEKITQRWNVANKRRFARAILEDRETTHNVIVCN